RAAQSMQHCDAHECNNYVLDIREKLVYPGVSVVSHLKPQVEAVEELVKNQLEPTLREMHARFTRNPELNELTDKLFDMVETITGLRKRYFDPTYKEMKKLGI
ncbi:MAG: hypothetical protein QW728_02930, partial [Thermoplasmata archaeon]